MASNPLPATDSTDIFRQLEEYPWDKDKEFLGGLSAILGPDPSPSQVEELTLRAQCFYLSRKKSIPIDFDGYKGYLASKSTDLGSTVSNLTNREMNQFESSDLPPPLPPHTSQPHPEADPPSEPKAAPYPPTFAQIVELITSGATIPGIKEIPPILLTSQATESTASKRRKPWEKDVPDNIIAGRDGGVIGGTFGDRRDDIVVQEVPDN